MVLESDGVTDLLTQATAELLRDALGDGHGLGRHHSSDAACLVLASLYIYV